MESYPFPSTNVWMVLVSVEFVRRDTPNMRRQSTESLFDTEHTRTNRLSAINSILHTTIACLDGNRQRRRRFYGEFTEMISWKDAIWVSAMSFRNSQQTLNWPLELSSSESMSFDHPFTHVRFTWFEILMLLALGIVRRTLQTHKNIEEYTLFGVRYGISFLTHRTIEMIFHFQFSRDLFSFFSPRRSRCHRNWIRWSWRMCVNWMTNPR